MLKSCEAGLPHLYISTHDYYLFVCALILFVFSLLWFLSLLGPDDWWDYPLHRWLKGSDILYVSLILPFCETVDWVTPKYTRLWLHDLFHCQCINLTQLLVWGKCIWVFLEAVRWAYREADEGMRKCSRSGGNEYFLRSWIGVVLSRGFGPKLIEFYRVNPHLIYSIQTLTDNWWKLLLIWFTIYRFWLISGEAFGQWVI